MPKFVWLNGRVMPLESAVTTVADVIARRTTTSLDGEHNTERTVTRAALRERQRLARRAAAAVS